jgi:hypothetical protein
MTTTVPSTRVSHGSTKIATSCHAYGECLDTTSQAASSAGDANTTEIPTYVHGARRTRHSPPRR